jgi:hypothetical protein
MRTALLEHPTTGVAVTNYEEHSDGRIYRRVRRAGCAGSGPHVAASCFRNFAFVSGVVVRRDRAQAHATGAWDGSEMYQMYLACRIIAEGHDLLGLEEVAVRKGISVCGESVDSYATRPKLDGCAITERNIPLGQMGRVVFDAVRPYAGGQQAQLATRVFLQILLFTYPFWIVEYRRVQSWRFAAGICLGMRPRNLVRQVDLPVHYGLLVRMVYLAVTCAGLLAPIELFNAWQPKLHAIAKSAFQRA